MAQRIDGTQRRNKTTELWETARRKKSATPVEQGFRSYQELRHFWVWFFAHVKQTMPSHP